MDEIILSAEQEAEAARIVDVVAGAARVEVQQLARLLASKSNGEFFGATEFQVRGVVQRLGARAIEAALEERKKGGIAGPV